MKETGVITALLNALDAYEVICQPLCKASELPRTSFDILMLLADNPELTSARDIVRLLHIRPNLVSVYVERLVHDGYLERQTVEGDRRKVRLVCTERAVPLIQHGRQVQASFLDSLFDGISPEEQASFLDSLFDGISPEEQAAFRQTVEQCRQNAERLIQQAGRRSDTLKKQAT